MARPVDLDLQVRILGSPTLELEAGSFSLHAETRSRREQQMRAHTVSSPYVEGEFTTYAVRQNVVEQLVVIIEATSHGGVLNAIDALEAQLRRTAYTIQWDWVGSPTQRETWSCFAANWTIESDQPLMVAKMAIVRAQVPRLPAIVRSTV